jgi:hypothetical protein
MVQKIGIDAVPKGELPRGDARVALAGSYHQINLPTLIDQSAECCCHGGR